MSRDLKAEQDDTRRWIASMFRQRRKNQHRLRRAQRWTIYVLPLLALTGLVARILLGH